MNKELFEILNEASIDSLVYEVLENAEIDEDEDDNKYFYYDYFEAVKGMLSSISFDLPDSLEEIEDFILT